jgi:hypothetical protein
MKRGGSHFVATRAIVKGDRALGKAKDGTSARKMIFELKIIRS